MKNNIINNKIKIISGKIKKLRYSFDKYDEPFPMRNLDVNGMIFRERFHPYVFNACISAEKINKYENNNKIIFPGQYKEFLLKIGNGGASGPLGTGIFSFEESLKNFSLCNLKNNLSIFDSIATFGHDFLWPVSREYTTNAFLIIKGAHKGEIWYLQEGRLVRIEDDFLTWIDKWLDYKLSMFDSLKGREKGIIKLNK